MLLRKGISLSATVGMVLLLPWVSTAQDKSEVRKGRHNQDGLIARAIYLLPPGFAAKLSLTEEQRQRIQKLEQEFKEKRRDVLAQAAGKVVSTVESMQQEDGQELAPVMAMFHEVTGGLLESRRLHKQYEQKMLALLTDSQKERLAGLKTQRPSRRQRVTAHTGEEGQMRKLLSAKQLDQLNLTEEQKKRFAALKQELETRFRDLLTDEQRQRLNELQRRGQTQQEDENPLPAKSRKDD
jgi:Spy/CpxP family protein refolding chaperone